MKKFLIILSITLFLIPIQAQEIDSSNSLVTFEISNFGFKSVEGSISNISGTADFNSENLNLCRFDVCLDAVTIDTDNTKRDLHLLEEDFFDVENHPEICFYSEEVIKLSDGYAVTGTLTIKGIEKSTTINFNYSDKTFLGNLNVDRFDFGLGSEGGFMIGRIVAIEIIAKI